MFCVGFEVVFFFSRCFFWKPVVFICCELKSVDSRASPSRKKKMPHKVMDLSTEQRCRFIHKDVNPSTGDKIVHKDADSSTEMWIRPLEPRSSAKMQIHPQRCESAHWSQDRPQRFRSVHKVTDLSPKIQIRCCEDSISSPVESSKDMLLLQQCTSCPQIKNESFLCYIIKKCAVWCVCHVCVGLIIMRFVCVCKLRVF